MPPAGRRTEFVGLLEDARRLIASRPGTDGSHKSLAAELRISPARVGDLLREDFYLELTDRGGKLFSAPRLRKAVTGFSASLERALLWLQREKLLIDRAVTTEAVLFGYWPKNPKAQFDTGLVRDAIADGKSTARLEHERLAKINVELWTLPWGPFADRGEEDSNKSGFLIGYARDLIKAVDPWASVTPQYKSLTQILDLPTRDRKKGLAVGVGVCETLYRKFQGLEFVSWPLLEFPIVCLLVSRSEINKEYSFDDLISGKISGGEVRLAAIDNDIGHAVLTSLLGGQRKINEELSAGLPEEVAEELKGKASEVPLALFADGIAAVHAFAELKRAGLNPKVVPQDSQSPDFSFSLGLMLRKEDKDLFPLLTEAQQQVLGLEWRLEHHIINFLDDVESWARQFGEELHDWPTEQPIVSISCKKIRKYIASFYEEAKAERTIVKIKKIKEERGSKIVNLLIGCT